MRAIYILTAGLVMFLGATGCHDQKAIKDDRVLPAVIPAHPRLFFSAGEEKKILTWAEDNVLLADLIRTLRSEADKMLTQPLQSYTAEGKLLSVSREEISRILTLSMAYRLFREEKYAAKVQEELLNVCSFPTWSPSHFLDDAEMTTAVAIGYDWCYDFLKPGDRITIEKSVVEKAFKPAWPIYETEGKTPFSRENNWNMVCNSGMVTGALAICDKYPAEVERIVRYAMRYTPNLLVAFAPEGVFNEGPGYWSYNGMYMSLFFDNLNRILKNDYGLTKFEGLANTARYYIAQTGAVNEPFNYGDASDNIDLSATFFLLSKQYAQTDVAAFYRDQIKEALSTYKNKGSFSFPRFFFLSIPWFQDPGIEKASETSLEIFNGLTDLLILNGNTKNDKNRLYLAAKTGRGSWSHNHLDGGSFVVDCDGERWGIEIGAENYSLPDFWDYKPGGIRWNYFRNTNFAHSTLSVDNRIFNSDGSGNIVRSDGTAPNPFGILDLTPYFPETADSVQRGFKLLSPKAILVRDEIKLKLGVKEVSWRFVTRANVDISGNTARLSQNGKEFIIKCLTDGYKMNVLHPVAASDKEKSLEGINIIEIKIKPSSQKFSISVLMGNKAEYAGDQDQLITGLSGWK